MSALTFEKEGHRYTLDGSPVRSVTGLLKKVGLINFDGIPPSILETARDRGTKVHAAIHYFSEGDLDVADFSQSFSHLAGYLQSWIRLADTGRLSARFCEHRVACRQPRFAGTFDFLGVFDGQAALLDHATGSPFDACKSIQTAFYVMAARAWANEPGEEQLKAFLDAHPYIARYSVQLDKHGDLPKLTAYTDPKDFLKARLIAEAVNIVDEERPKSQAWDWQQELAA